MTWLDEVVRANPDYVESMYQAYRRDPGSVDERWGLLFAGYEWAREGAEPAIADLVHSYRELGHLVADLDPLGGSPRTHPLLQLEELGLREQDLDRVVDWAPLHGGGRGPLRGMLRALAETYTGTLGIEYLGISD
ncbi:MAG: 2-oxoglutarate dehydrogenase E1 component, partial [Candidatus Rokuibacteriota bacterium]